MTRGDRVAKYQGTFADKDRINGTVNVSGADNMPMEFAWTAARKAPEGK